jgi:hypothetical protein
MIYRLYRTHQVGGDFDNLDALREYQAEMEGGDADGRVEYNVQTIRTDYNNPAVFKGLHESATYVQDVADRTLIPPVRNVLIDLAHELRSIVPNVVPEREARAKLVRMIKVRLSDVTDFADHYHWEGRDDIADDLRDIDATVCPFLRDIDY